MSENIITQIREEKIDANNQESFFSALVKGLLLNLKKDISIRNIPVPHIILSTGDDIMYLENKGQDDSVEPLSVSNEDYIYNTIPRCVVQPGAVDVIPDQLTNPYARGVFQIEHDNEIKTVSAEMRRMPIKMSVDLKYYVDSYRDIFELIQMLIAKLSFIRTYNITYMGQAIQCSYRLPENFNEEHLMEIDGQTTDNRNKSLDVSLEIETNLPVYSNRTAVSCDQIIANHKYNHDIE